MRIMVINTAASSGGALSILKDFYQYVKENGTANEWIFLLSDYHLEETENITVKVLKNVNSKYERLKFDHFTGYKLINEYNPDVVFSMQNTTIANISVPQTVYLHQAIPFQKVKNYSFLNKEESKYAFIQYFLGANIKQGLSRADKVIVQTKWMKDAVIEQAKISYENIVVIPPSVKVEENTINKEQTLQTNNFFYPTSSESYKNISLIEKACDYIDSLDSNLNYKVDITVNEKFKNNHINSIGEIPRDEVITKLNKEVLVFPSFIETFGLPLAEGKIMNSVILASDTLFSREILQDYNNGYFFNPFNEKELGRLMIDSINGQITKYPRVKDKEVFDNSWEKVCKLLSSFSL